MKTVEAWNCSQWVSGKRRCGEQVGVGRVGCWHSRIQAKLSEAVPGPCAHNSLSAAGQGNVSQAWRRQCLLETPPPDRSPPDRSPAGPPQYIAGKSGIACRDRPGWECIHSACALHTLKYMVHARKQSSPERIERRTASQDATSMPT